jgi:hypothetical protein
VGIIRRIEDTLLASRAFTLPGKKQLQKVDTNVEVVVIDVTETLIERTKKNKSDFSVEKRKTTRLSHRSL